MGLLLRLLQQGLFLGIAQGHGFLHFLGRFRGNLLQLGVQLRPGLLGRLAGLGGGGFIVGYLLFALFQRADDALPREFVQEPHQKQKIDDGQRQDPEIGI